MKMKNILCVQMSKAMEPYDIRLNEQHFSERKKKKSNLTGTHQEGSAYTNASPSLSTMSSLSPAGGGLLPGDHRQCGDGRQPALCFPGARQRQPAVEHHPRWSGALPPQT